jgi:hypothetical protein
MNAGVFYNSEPKSLPIPFVNNNDFRIIWTSATANFRMVTRQASYYINHIPINNWSLSAMLHSGSNLANDSACFIVMYI